MILQNSLKAGIILSMGVLSSFVVWLGILFVEGRNSVQWQLFVANNGDFWADFLNVVGYSSERDPYNNMMYSGLEQKGYPPITYIILHFFSRLVNINIYQKQNFFLNMYEDQNFLIIFVIIMMITFIGLYEISKRYIEIEDGPQRMLIGFSVILSYPILFTFQRGNTILQTILFLMIYVRYYKSENRYLKEIALVSLAIAASLKVIPALFGILLFYERKWKDIIKEVIYGGVFFFLPFLFLKGGLANIPLMMHNMQLFFESIKENPYNISFLGCIEGIYSYGENSRIFCIILAKGFALLFLLGGIFFDEEWKRLLSVGLTVIILPSYAGSYDILYLYPAILTFYNKEKLTKKEWIYCGLFLSVLVDIGIPNDGRIKGIQIVVLSYILFMIVECSGSCIRYLRCIYSGRKSGRTL